MSDFWDAAKGVLGTVAPTLATAVGGPLAGVAVTALVKALGMVDGSAPEEVAAAVAGATPEQLVALRKADQDFAVQMRGLDISLDKLTYDDRANARAREVAIKDWVPGALALGITLGFFGLLGVACYRGFPEANKDALNILLGSLGAGFTMVLSYYFGGMNPAVKPSASKTNG